MMNVKHIANDRAGCHQASGLGFIRFRAFTLLELLLAILVFSIVLSAIHVVFFSAFKLQARSVEAIDRSLPLLNTLAIIKRDLENIVPPGGTLSGALQSTPTSITQESFGDGEGPQFYTAVGIVDDNAPWGEIERVSYRLMQPTNDVPGMDLFRSVTRNLLPVMQTESEDQFLMNGVETITFRYHDGSEWRDTWDSMEEDPVTGLTNNLPSAVKLEIELYNPNPSAGSIAPVELIVPLMAQALTNMTPSIE